MIQPRLVLAVVVGAVSFGGGAAYAATHGSAKPARTPVRAQHPAVSNMHYPCHHHDVTAQTAAQL